MHICTKVCSLSLTHGARMLSPAQFLQETLEKSFNDPEALCRRAHFLRYVANDVERAAMVRLPLARDSRMGYEEGTWNQPRLMDEIPAIQFSVQLYERAAALDRTSSAKYKATFAQFLFETCTVST